MHDYTTSSAKACKPQSKEERRTGNPKMAVSLVQSGKRFEVQLPTSESQFDECGGKFPTSESHESSTQASDELSGETLCADLPVHPMKNLLPEWDTSVHAPKSKPLGLAIKVCLTCCCYVA